MYAYVHVVDLIAYRWIHGTVVTFPGSFAAVEPQTRLAAPSATRAATTRSTHSYWERVVASSPVKAAGRSGVRLGRREDAWPPRSTSSSVSSPTVAEMTFLAAPASERSRFCLGDCAQAAIADEKTLAKFSVYDTN